MSAPQRIDVTSVIDGGMSDNMHRLYGAQYDVRLVSRVATPRRYRPSGRKALRK